MDNQRQIGIARIYTKDLSFESPLAPKIFLKTWEPKVDLRVAVKHQDIEESLFEVVLEITAEAKNADAETGFIVEVEQAGIFDIRGFGSDELNHALEVFCPTNLFPYARQAIDHCLSQGGFPPLALAPVNFEVVYQQKLDKAKDKPKDK